jgi:hypothetical protein
MRQTASLVGRQSEPYRFDPSWPPRVLAWQPEYSLRLPGELDPLFRLAVIPAETTTPEAIVRRIWKKQRK